MKLPLWFRNYCQEASSTLVSAGIARKASALFLALTIGSISSYYFGPYPSFVYFIIFCGCLLGWIALAVAHEVITGLIEDTIFRVAQKRREELRREGKLQ
jgi:hypothetical protein